MYDFDLIVIGAGPGGYVAALKAAKVMVMVIKAMEVEPVVVDKMAKAKAKAKVKEPLEAEVKPNMEVMIKFIQAKTVKLHMVR